MTWSPAPPLLDQRQRPPGGRRLRASPSTSVSLRTPAGAPLRAPTAALAAAIAAEWDALEAEIDPERLPLTRLANSAIDRVEPQHAAVAAAIAEYGATDLLCYRAEGPAALAARQAAAWDPWLLWARRALGAPLLAVARRDAPAPARQPASPPSAPRWRPRMPSDWSPCTISSPSRARSSSASPSGAARSTLPRPGSSRASTRPGRPSTGASTPRPRRPPRPAAPSFLDAAALLDAPRLQRLRRQPQTGERSTIRRPLLWLTNRYRPA